MEINPLPMLSLKGRLDYMLQIWLPVPYKKKFQGETMSPSSLHVLRRDPPPSTAESSH